MKRNPLQSKILPRKSPMLRKSRPKSSPERKAARGKPCLFNVANVCNYDSATVVLVHLRWLGNCGTGAKPSDYQAVHGCSECNRWTDSPTPTEAADREKYESDRNYYAARGLVRMRLLEREAA